MYVVIIEDSHTDIGVELFSNFADAEKYVLKLAFDIFDVEEPTLVQIPNRYWWYVDIDAEALISIRYCLLDAKKESLE